MVCVWPKPAQEPCRPSRRNGLARNSPNLTTPQHRKGPDQVHINSIACFVLKMWGHKARAHGKGAGTDNFDTSPRQHQETKPLQARRLLKPIWISPLSGSKQRMTMNAGLLGRRVWGELECTRLNATVSECRKSLSFYLAPCHM